MKALRGKRDALQREYDAIVREHPELRRIRDEIRELSKPIEDARWRAVYYRYQASRDKVIFREIIAEGDTMRECEERAKAKVS